MAGRLIPGGASYLPDALEACLRSSMMPKRDLAGKHSIRINDQWRVVFRWTDAGPEDVEIIDYHWPDRPNVANEKSTQMAKKLPPVHPGEIQG